MRPKLVKEFNLDEILLPKPKKLKNTFADKIIINLSKCHYDVIKEVITNDFPDFSISYNENFF